MSNRPSPSTNTLTKEPSDRPTGTAVPDFPRVDATFDLGVNGEPAVTIAILGTERRFEGHGADDSGDLGGEARTDALTYVQHVAASPQLGRPVRVHTHVCDTDHGQDVADPTDFADGGEVACLIVTPEGNYYDEDKPQDIHQLPHLQHQRYSPELPGELLSTLCTGVATTTSTDHSGAGTTPGSEHDQHQDRQFNGVPAPVADASVSNKQATYPPTRTSFIQTQDATRPAALGWRGALNKVGLRLAPGPAENAVRDDIATVRQHWAGPRTVAIANPKGSANKTPTTAMLSAAFARYGGAGVLAWDNNETRGSLAWRTERAGHGATVLDLIPQATHLLSDLAHSAELTSYTHHQPADKYDVLASDQSVAGDHEVSAVDVERLHHVATRYYRLILMDSGNNERAMNWRTMISHAHTLVLPCTNVEDTAEAGALMLEALTCRDEHSAHLARGAVAIVSQRTPGKDSNMNRIVEGLRPLVRDVVTIPFDPALVSGVIHFDDLRPATQRAWLRAAAAIALGL